MEGAKWGSIYPRGARVTAGFARKGGPFYNGPMNAVMELVCAVSAAIHGRAAQAAGLVGLYQPGDGVLGAAQAVWGAFGDYGFEVGDGVRLGVLLN